MLSGLRDERECMIRLMEERREGEGVVKAKEAVV